MNAQTGPVWGGNAYPVFQLSPGWAWEVAFQSTQALRRNQQTTIDDYEVGGHVTYRRSRVRKARRRCNQCLQEPVPSAKKPRVNPSPDQGRRGKKEREKRTGRAAAPSARPRALRLRSVWRAAHCERDVGECLVSCRAVGLDNEGEAAAGVGRAALELRDHDGGGLGHRGRQGREGEERELCEGHCCCG